MNDKYNEHELEMSIIQMFEEKGYTYIQENDDWIVNRKLDDFIIEDVLIYINGIPLIIFELKSIEDREDATIENAYNQLGGNSDNSGYRYDIPTLFNYNAFCVISDGANNRLGTITSDFERYSEWKSVDGKEVYKDYSVNKLDVMIDGVFTKDRLLDIIKNNLFFIDKDK